MRGRWPVLVLIIVVVLVANIVGLVNFVGPYLVTHVANDTPPQGVSCVLCGDPEVRRALAYAARLGREEAMTATAPHSVWWWLLLIVNIGAPVTAWFAARRSSAG
jgi:hypothetical protein